MCQDIGHADALVLGRRSLFGGTAAIAAGALLTACSPNDQAAAPTPSATAEGDPANTPQTAQPVPQTGTFVVTLGTAAGPALRSPRQGIATAIVVDGQVYLIDCGLGVSRQIVAAGLDMAKLRGIFVTHLHSDHVSEVPGVLLYNWGPPVQGFTERFEIVGPGSAGQLPEGYPAPINPATPGTKEMVDDLLAAYAYDINIRITDEARPPLNELAIGRDIQLPAGVTADARSALFPDMEPFVMFEDERVRVLAALVEHPPVFPSFGFRFETAAGVVALSGDTAEHDNVVRLAQNADILVHESVYLPYYRERGLS